MWRLRRVQLAPAAQAFLQGTLMVEPAQAAAQRAGRRWPWRVGAGGRGTAAHSVLPREALHQRHPPRGMESGLVIWGLMASRASLVVA